VSPYAVKYGLGRAWGYSVISSGVWPPYWLHRNRRLFDGELGRGRDDAAFHTVGLFVPVLLAIGAVGWLLSILWFVLLILSFFDVGPLADVV
jgi:hypothetical protein